VISPIVFKKTDFRYLQFIAAEQNPTIILISYEYHTRKKLNSQTGSRKGKTIYCGMNFPRFTGFFFDSTWFINEGVPINLEHWIQIITTIPEILSADYSFNRTTDKRIIP